MILEILGEKSLNIQGKESSSFTGKEHRGKHTSELLSKQ